ncbi:hypothetical protein Pth03_33500 [Planotetraspora thailandica]|uniref:Uncharacterized protein n=1 Tax=Planotetraspora thailandica TaxID=487172 RepID=A0A8J3V4Q7_9ACTN|nr:hypothetical protein [Planotetraspora thailandica]GII54961.1 hypothetical protein Pth03_33500 [Planotetraspora thailandica]
MRHITHMGTIALSAAFLAIAAQSAASAEGNPNAEKALKRAAQFVPNERNFEQQQNRTDFTSLTVSAGPRTGGLTGATSAFNAIPIQAFQAVPPNIASSIRFPFQR